MAGWIIDDAARLRTLAELGILDTPAEASFDGIARAAAALCDAPVALVSLLERDRQWFKARVGTEATETPIGMAICAHTLAHGALLVIPDLSADPRTADNALVTGPPHVRFYAGAPLVVRGQALGTLCVLDTVARPAGLADPQRRGLASLAEDLVDLVENHARAGIPTIT